MLTIRPQPWARISGSAAAVVWKAEVRLIATIWSHLRGRELGHRRHVLDAGVVDQDVDPAERVVRLGDQRPALLALGHVGLDVDDADPVLAGDPLGERVVLGPVGERVQHDVGAGAGQLLGDPEPDPGVRPGDHRAPFRLTDMPRAPSSLRRHRRAP